MKIDDEIWVSVDSTLYIITGFTAVGKTRLSLDWAKANEAEIISCDSLLFYQGMDIGTAKPTAEEMEEVPHHLIDMVPPSRQYSIDEYLRQVRETVVDIHRRGKRVLVVGGSGFYLNAFFAPVVDHLRLDPEVEAEITDRFDHQPLEDSVAELLKLNPEGLGDLDIENPRRVIKAWLRCVAAGKPLKDVLEDFKKLPGSFDHYDRQLLVLSRPKEELEERVKLRVDQMIEAGLIEEVRGLIAQGILDNPSAAGAIGYRETISFLKGELSEPELAPLISQNTRRLLKKQRTWFKKFLPADALFDVSGATSLPARWHEVRRRTDT